MIDENFSPKDLVEIYMDCHPDPIIGSGYSGSNKYKNAIMAQQEKIVQLLEQIDELRAKIYDCEKKKK